MTQSNNAITVFSSQYGGEDLGDLNRDIHEMHDPIFNPDINNIPQNDIDKHGIHKGQFVVTVQYIPDEN